MEIFFSVGEPSGDLHGGNVIRALKKQDPSIRCVGFGGPQMESAGCELHFRLTRFAVMWFAQVIRHLPRFFKLLDEAEEYFQSNRPDAVVLIDYPGFNWHIAKRAKRAGIPVFYYGVPQLWGWAGWRIKKMQQYVDYPLCKLPFEEDWYQERGCAARYVGHPYFDELSSRKLDQEFVHSQQKDSPLVALLPGSRDQEVTANLPMMLAAAGKVNQRQVNVRFAIASFNKRQAEVAKEMVDGAGLDVEIHIGRTGELIAAADCAIAVSGSVSLELLYHATPAVIVYKISRVAFLAQRIFRKVRYIALANLVCVDNPLARPAGCYDPTEPLDQDVPLPEYLTYRDASDQISGHVLKWLEDESVRKVIEQRLSRGREQIGAAGASARAATEILAVLRGQAASGRMDEANRDDHTTGTSDVAA